ncbi:MAG: leucine-rich repeat domain-containing protein, partial [Bacteroidaceae bacterium]|nr:leucine-rich repeat domain-containing protein [Bacteroidaceae bacterium]
MKTNVLQAKKALLALFAMLMPMLASAHDFELGGIYYNVLSSANLTVEVTYKGDYVSYNDDRYKGTVVIPETVTYNGNTYQVIWIGENAFYGCRNLSSVTMPNSVVGIDERALSGCVSLTFVSISENATSIGYYAFSDCSNLSSITIPEATISIAEGAFCGCTSLTNLKIPQRVENIGKNSFGSCESLTTIVVDEGNKVYDSRNGCNAIIETESNTLIVGCRNSVIPNTVTAIGDMAFRMHPLNQITIPKQIKSIGDEAFAYCGATSIKVEEGNSWYDSRNGCNAIIETESNTLIVGCKNSVIPNTVTAIGGYAFAETDLWSISLPNGLKKIGEGAFEGCRNLTSITIPEGVTSIGDWAFSHCSSLTAITIPKSVTSIGSSAFSFCNSITAITIPEGVTSIGNSAFYGSYSLSTINVPTSVIEIGQNAFWGTPWYNNKPDGITYINNVLYEYKGEMPANTSIEVKDGVVSITPQAFYNRSNLVSITLPESVDKIGEWAFAYCSSLSSITLPQKMSSIGETAFGACSSLTSIVVPEGITTIE